VIKSVCQLLGVLVLVVGSSCLFTGCAEDNNANAMKGSTPSSTATGPGGATVDPLTGTVPPATGASTEEGRKYEEARKKKMYANYPGSPP
jgi:hypothetical protein